MRSLDRNARCDFRSAKASMRAIPSSSWTSRKISRKRLISFGSPSAASIRVALILVIPRMHTAGGWSCKNDRYVRTISMIFGSRSRAFKKRWSPAADCSVSLTMGGRIGSRSGGCSAGFSVR